MAVGEACKAIHTADLNAGIIDNCRFSPEGTIFSASAQRDHHRNAAEPHCSIHGRSRRLRQVELRDGGAHSFTHKTHRFSSSVLGFAAWFLHSYLF